MKIQLSNKTDRLVFQRASPVVLKRQAADR